MPLSHASIAARMLTAGLPTFARTVSRLEHLITTAEAPAHAVAAVIATDPTITALVIGQANAGGHATTLLSDAVRHIGLGVVLTTARSALKVPDAQRQALASCWAQANAVATLMPILVDHRRYHLKGNWDDETLHVIGLIHDIGHILVLSHFPREYDSACSKLEQGEDGFSRLIAAELGASPELLAAMAGLSWSLPKPLLAAMTHWRNPAQAGEYAELCAIVHIAHVLVQAAGFTAAGDRFVPPLDEWSLSLLDLRISDFETIMTRMFESMDELELYEGALGG